MRLIVPDRELRAASPEVREKKLRELSRVAHSAPNGEVRDMDQLIGQHEVRAGMSSDEMRRRVGAGQLQESPDVLDWLLLLRRRALFKSR